AARGPARAGGRARGARAAERHGRGEALLGREQERAVENAAAPLDEIAITLARPGSWRRRARFWYLTPAAGMRRRAVATVSEDVDRATGHRPEVDGGRRPPVPRAARDGDWARCGRGQPPAHGPSPSRGGSARSPRAPSRPALALRATSGRRGTRDAHRRGALRDQRRRLPRPPLSAGEATRDVSHRRHRRLDRVRLRG